MAQGVDGASIRPGLYNRWQNPASLRAGTSRHLEIWIIANLPRRGHLPKLAFPQLPARRQSSTRIPEESASTRRIRLSGSHSILLLLALTVGSFARIWEFGRLPPSLNPDEASTGVEARNLYDYGHDRNGIGYPVKFISWGSGQDVLYTYLLIPLVATAGLSPIAVRLPMLVLGLLSMPLTYLAVRSIFNAQVGLMAAFMLAISPWHILLSRWALDSNLFPVVFLAGFTCLLLTARNGWWFAVANVLLALCLYSYGTAYLVVPIFWVFAVLRVARSRLVATRMLAVGVGTFVVLSAPIGLLLLVNLLRLPSVALGPITVPRFPVPVRWETTTVAGASDIPGALAQNIGTGTRLLMFESDTILYNVVEPFGYFYRFGLVLALMGVTMIVMHEKSELRASTQLLFAWLGTALMVPLFQEVNINRLNIIFLPMLIVGAYALDWVQSRHAVAGPTVVAVLLAMFAAFTVKYHGHDYRVQVDFKFQNGILPALRFAKGHTNGAICVTDKTNMPYIYALFAEPISPSAFLASVDYVDESAPLRHVASFGRYSFGARNCPQGNSPVYVLTAYETPPRLGNRYSYEFFNDFVVYYPRP